MFFTTLAETYRLEELHAGNQFGNLFGRSKAAVYTRICLNLPWQFEPIAADGANEEG